MVTAPVRRRSTQQGRSLQYDKYGRPFRSEVTQGPDFDLSPAPRNVVPVRPTLSPDELDEIQARVGRQLQPEIDAQARLIGSVRNANPRGRAVVIDGERFLANAGYGPRSTTGVSANRTPLSGSRVGVGRASSGVTTGGAIGSSLMLGPGPGQQEEVVRPSFAYKPGRGPMIGSAVDASGKSGPASVTSEEAFQELWRKRNKLPRSSQQVIAQRNAQPDFPAGTTLQDLPQSRPANEEVIGGSPGNLTIRRTKPDGTTEVFNEVLEDVGSPAAAVIGTPMMGGPMSAGLAAASLGAAPRMPPGLRPPAAYRARPRPPARPVTGVAPGAAPPLPPIPQASTGPAPNPVQPRFAPGPGGPAYTPPTPAPPVAPATPPAPTGPAPNPIQPRFPPGRGGPTYNPFATTAAPTTAAPGAPTAPVTPAAAAAAGGFPWKTAGIGAGVVTIGGIAYLASPDGTPIAPVPVAGPDEDQVYNSRIWGPTTDPIAAANRARHENKLASREALVTNRGIGRGERRDIRLGKARADVLAKYRLAGSPEAMAAMYGAQQRAVGEQAEPMLYSQLGQRNSAMNALQAQWSEEATPEGRARIEQQMQSLNAQPFSVPQGQTPDQFRQSLFPSTPVAPLLPPTVRPRTGPAIPPPGAGNATGGNGEPPLEVVPPGQVRGLAEKPTVPVFNPRLTGADAIAQEHEIKAKEKALEDWKYQAGQLERGNIPFDDPEVKQLAGPWAGLDDKRFAQRMSVRFGIPYESALQQVQAYRSRFLPGNHPGTTVMGAY